MYCPHSVSRCFRIGSHRTASFENSEFNGYINDLKIWDRAISNDEINNLPNDYIAHWDFNEGEGNVLYDLTGNSNNGIIYGTTWSNSEEDLCCVDAENDADGDGICESDEIYGCTDINGCNFGEEFTELCIEESTEYINGNCDLCNYPDINYDCSGNCLDLGDLNFDGEHNIQDIVIMVDIILENSEFNVCSDINIDSFANIFDLIMLIDIILE